MKITVRDKVEYEIRRLADERDDALNELQHARNQTDAALEHIEGLRDLLVRAAAHVPNTDPFRRELFDHLGLWTAGEK